MFADAPQGICSVCLFRTGLALLDDKDDKAFEPTVARMLKDFGDYELLEEIGRGGQGVVYRARQKSLNRIVALKVIGLAHWATEAHVKRFRLEAEAAASLNHPCIVPIYEVGERDGACYFSMGLMEGGQLDAVAARTDTRSRSGTDCQVGPHRFLMRMNTAFCIATSNLETFWSTQKAIRISPISDWRGWSKQRARSRARWKFWALPATWRRNKL